VCFAGGTRLEITFHTSGNTTDLKKAEDDKPMQTETTRKSKRYSRDDVRSVAEISSPRLTQPMTAEEALFHLAATVRENNLDLRGILLNCDGRTHEYSRLKTISGGEATKIEAAAQSGRTHLTLLFTGGASAETLSELYEAANRTARRIELCETIVGTSLPIRKLKETVELAASCSSTTLITGESGTGKELVAQTLHNLSDRAGNPFVSVNCGALSEALLESELFGYVKGAFTGATANKKGLFEAAHKGTIFLDEFGEMSSAMQVKLLRVLQERKVRPVGATDAETPVDVRVIVATNKDLEREVREGRFRQDLYFRVNVLTIEVPPLRERRTDIPTLTRHLLEKVHNRAGLNAPAEIEPTAVLLLGEYDWAGNVRELENKLERLSVIAGKQGTITAEHVRDALGAPGLPASFETKTSAKGGIWRESLDRIKKDRIETALVLAGGNQAQAASLLGMKRSAFHRLHKRVQQRTAAKC